MSKILKFLEVCQKDDIYAAQGATRWGNRDLYPIVVSERTISLPIRSLVTEPNCLPQYISHAYFSYWVQSGVCITARTLGSSLIGYGLTAGEACGAVLTGSVIAGVMAVLCGQVGRDLHLGVSS
jgi:NCS1 family nucleobase:cation symporter-1